MKPLHRMFAIVIASLAIFFSQACFLTDKIGLAPLGSIKGADLRDRIASIVQVNFFLGVYSYCTQFKPVDVCLEESLSPAVTGGIAAGIIASNYVEGLEDDSYYTVQSASDCLRSAGYSVNFLVFSILDGKKRCDSVGCLPARGSEVSSASLTTGLLGASLCELEETGNVLSIGRYNFSLPLPEPLD